MVREKLGAFSVIPIRNEDVPICKTCGRRYRKQMKRGYTKTLYHQRNKDETIVSVIKRLFGEHIRSRHVITQNRELSLRCIAYNMHRLTNLVIIIMISTEPVYVMSFASILYFYSHQSCNIPAFFIRYCLSLYQLRFDFEYQVGPVVLAIINLGTLTPNIVSF